jgi:hypothetical protein
MKFFSTVRSIRQWLFAGALALGLSSSVQLETAVAQIIPGELDHTSSATRCSRIKITRMSKRWIWSINSGWNQSVTW